MKGRLLDVTECAACRGHHTRVLFVPLANQPGRYAAACPMTGTTIFSRDTVTTVRKRKVGAR